jgi:FMN phosphatase YigB (HAD superfamily)
MVLDNFLIRNFENLIFDFDGTICNLPVDWIVKRKKFCFFARELFDFKLQGCNRIDEMEYELLKFFPDRRNQILEFRRNVESNASMHYTPNVNLVKLIINIEKKAFIVSNNLTETITPILKDLNIYHKFMEIIGVNTFYNPKPSLVSWNYLSKKFNLNKEKTLLIGDSPQTDGMYAKKSGIFYLQINSASFSI